MSWSETFYAENRDAAVKMVRDRQSINPNFPREHAEAIVACISLVAYGKAVNITAYGHADPNNNNLNISIT